MQESLRREAKQGRVLRMEVLLRDPTEIDPDAPDRDGNTALHIAAAANEVCGVQTVPSARQRRRCRGPAAACSAPRGSRRRWGAACSCGTVPTLRRATGSGRRRATLQRSAGGRRPAPVPAGRHCSAQGLLPASCVESDGCQRSSPQRPRSSRRAPRRAECVLAPSLYATQVQRCGHLSRECRSLPPGCFRSGTGPGPKPELTARETARELGAERGARTSAGHSEYPGAPPPSRTNRTRRVPHPVLTQNTQAGIQTREPAAQGTPRSARATAVEEIQVRARGYSSRSTERDATKTKSTQAKPIAPHAADAPYAR